MFDSLDIGQDGIVKKSDFDAAMTNRRNWPGSHMPTWDRFAARFGTNHDGQISRAEFEAARAQQRVQSSKAYLHRAGLEAQMFAFADLNADEMRAMPKPHSPKGVELKPAPARGMKSGGTPLAPSSWA